MISNEPKNLRLKIYDIRRRPSYSAKLAFASENPNFDIKNVMVNDVAQICESNNNQLWPKPTTVETTTMRKIYTTTPSSTTTQRRFDNSKEVLATTESSVDDFSCGKIKKVDSFGNYVVLPSQPGKYPWTVSIYRYTNDEEESYYKCGGTIIDQTTILTSVNCLLEDGQLLKPIDLQIYVAPFSLSAKRPRHKIFNISKFVTHERYNFYLENNIAALKLTRALEFNQYVQPICLPTDDTYLRGMIGKVGLKLS